MKVLIAYVSAGAGHRQAAEAVADAFRQSSSVTTVLHDALTHASPWFRRGYPWTYLFLVRYLQWFWGLTYHLLNVPWLYRAGLGALRRVFNRVAAGGFEAYLRAEQPDVIIGTHFLVGEAAAALKRRGAIRSRIVVVVTDYVVHALWVVPGVDLYVVATDATRNSLMAQGVEASRIRVLGIPVHPRFSRPADVDAIRQRIGLSDDRLTVLVVSGGFGVGPIRSIVESLDVTSLHMQVIVVCGRNPRLTADLQRRMAEAPYVRVFGFVTNMDELMAVSDVMVTKPGGLTVSEALVRHLPLWLVRPIPGQESGNAGLLVKSGAARLVTTPEQVAALCRECVEQPETLAAMRRAAEQLARPTAAQDVMREALAE